MSAVERLLPSAEAEALLELTRELAEKELAPRAAEFEERAEFPREVFRTLGRAGLLGLPYPEEYGGGGQPYEVYLQVVEELAGAWLAVGLGVSVHTLACFPTAAFGTEEQRRRWLPDDARRGTARRLLPVRAGVGIGRRRAQHPGGARGRGVPGQRRQGVGHPRRRRGLLQPDGAHRRHRPARHLLPARRGRHGRPATAAAGEEDGHVVESDRPDRAGRRPDR